MIATDQAAGQPVAAARGRGAGWRALGPAALAAGWGLLLLLQLALWPGGIAAKGGLDRFLRERADLFAVVTGGEMIRAGAGDRLYDLGAQHDFQVRLLAPYGTPEPGQTLPNSHPPLESLFAAVALGAGPAGVYLLWAALSVAAFAAGLWVLARAVPLPGRWRAPLILAASAYHPLHLALWTGQSSTLVFLGLAGTYAALRARREGLAGLALAVAALKPQLALWVVIMLVVQRRWRALGVLAATWAAIAVALMPLLGVGWPLAYLRLLAGAGTWGPQLYEYPPLMHNWRGLLSYLLAPWPGAIRPVAAALSLATLTALGWGWWRTGRVPAAAGGAAGRAAAGWGLRDDLRWAFTIAATLLLAQHLYHHDLVLLIIPAWLIVSRVATGELAGGRGWLIGLAVGGAVPLVTFFIATAPAVIVPSALTLIALAGAIGWAIGRRRDAAQATAV